MVLESRGSRAVIWLQQGLGWNIIFKETSEYVKFGKCLRGNCWKLFHLGG